jgi:CheY-like chemotaxis protein
MAAAGAPLSTLLQALATELQNLPWAEPGQALADTLRVLVEQARRYEQREQSQQQTLAQLAHDVRNPLGPLRTAAELMLRANGDPVAFERAHGVMTRQLALLASLTEELGHLAHPEMADGAVAAAGAPRAAGDAAPAPHPDGAAHQRVLVADDNELVRESFVDLLSGEGFEVRTACDGLEAIAIADQWRPQVVLLDIHMPRLSGLETARRLRANYPPGVMKLLMLSGMNLNEAWVRHAHAAGFDDCLDKTADPQTWLPRLREAPAA